MIDLDHPTAFRIWNYVVSKRRLQIRSEKKIQAEKSCFLGLTFHGVEYLQLPTEFVITRIQEAPLFSPSGLIPIRMRDELRHFQFFAEEALIGSIITLTVQLDDVTEATHLGWTSSAFHNQQETP